MATEMRWRFRDSEKGCSGKARCENVELELCYEVCEAYGALYIMAASRGVVWNQKIARIAIMDELESCQAGIAILPYILLKMTT
jgi:hypothetical protein